jgi:hypothetical protein
LAGQVGQRLAQNRFQYTIHPTLKQKMILEYEWFAAFGSPKTPVSIYDPAKV